MPKHCKSISVSARTFARLAARAKADGVSISSVLESAIGYLPSSGPLPDVAAVPVSLDLYLRVGKIARRKWLPFAEVMDAAIVRALDDAEAFPRRAKGWRQRRTPMVDHARRAA